MQLAFEFRFVAVSCVAVCCSVLQCVAVCCSVLRTLQLAFQLQCVAGCCSVLQCVEDNATRLWDAVRYEREDI